MKLWHFQLDEKVYPMCLNGTALFDVYEKYGDKGSILDLIEGNDRQSFRATCWMLAKLCEAGQPWLASPDGSWGDCWKDQMA